MQDATGCSNNHVHLATSKTPDVIAHAPPANKSYHLDVHVVSERN